MQDDTRLWTYLAVAEYNVPSPPVSHAARWGARRLWRWARGLVANTKDASNDKTFDVDRPSAELLHSLTTEPDWSEAARRLDHSLGDDWFNNRRPTRLVRACVGAPGCNISGILQRLAQQRGLSVLAPPPPESLLNSTGLNASDRQSPSESADAILVIPNLERWFLRHENGLTALRALIEQLASGGQRALIGCDSWAWSFLQRAVGIEGLLGQPQSLAPFDACRLDLWFRSSLKLQTFEFRERDGNQEVFPDLAPADDETGDAPKRERSALMTSLAARARGNLGVALAVWRECLRTREKDDDREAPPAGSRVLWVVSPDELSLPEIPANADRMHRFLLHSILVHGGLPLSAIYGLMPFSREDVRGRIGELQNAGVIEQRDERLQVSLAAYPAVRRDLHGEGFLTDAF